MVIAAIAFTLRFFAEDTIQSVCDILAFALPTLAAIVEIIVSEKASRKVNDEIQKRPVREYLSQEEYDRREAEGTLDENTYYATPEEE